MKILDTGGQRTPEWFNARRGLPTSSVGDKIITTTGRPSTSAAELAGTLVAEELGLQDPEYKFATYWTDRGIDLEAESSGAFSLITGYTITNPDFILNDAGTAGCSPDGLVWDGDKLIAGLELKNPKPSTHISRLVGDKFKMTYRAQCHLSMVITGLDQWYAMSYCPGVRPLIILHKRDEFTKKLEVQLDNLIALISDLKEELS